MFKAPFSFNGRIRRLEYGLSFIVSYIISLLLYGSSVVSLLSGEFGLGVLISIIVFIAAIWFNLAQGVKRLHDLNKNGLLILICCIPIIGILFSLYMIFVPGTTGSNDYGEDPKNRQ